MGCEHGRYVNPIVCDSCGVSVIELNAECLTKVKGVIFLVEHRRAACFPFIGLEPVGAWLDHWLDH